MIIFFFLFLCKTRDFRFFDDVVSNSHFLKCSMNLCWIFVFFHFAKWKTKFIIDLDFFFRIFFYKSLSSFFFDDIIKNQRFHCIVFLFIVCRRMLCCFREKNALSFFFDKFESLFMLFEFEFFFFRNQSCRKSFDADWLKCRLINQIICLWQKQRCKSWNKKHDKLKFRLFCVKTAK